MHAVGNLIKMKSELQNPVHYFLQLDDKEIFLNDFLGKKIDFNYQHTINCMGCGVETIKSFGQGFCYKCFISRPETDACIMNPELCQAHLGVYRDEAFAKNTCLKDHFVYLAVSSHLKVGVTRATQIPTRWIDQGASRAIKLAQTPYRALAGEIEVELKHYFSDKTSWQKMLKGITDETINLEEAKQKAFEYLPEELAAYVIEDDEITNLNYPVLEYPTKVKSLGFDKFEHIGGTLTGIKGQYLMFDNQFVLNIRKHGGYKVEFSA